jgi:hypothetical protein
VIEYYSPIKKVQVTAVFSSGSLVFVRGLMVLNNRQVAMAVPGRGAGYYGTEDLRRAQHSRNCRRLK